jgi:hypothetical protein
MSKFPMFIGVAAIAGAMYVAAASGSQQSRGPTAKQFKALKAQVAGLKGQVTGLKGQVATLNGEAAAVAQVLTTCMHGAVPIADFGDPNGTFGYHWFDSTDGEILTTALDVTSSSDPNALWITGSTGTACHTLLGAFAAKAGAKLQPFKLPATFAAHKH